MITERQQNILNEAVKLYIDSAKPVSSELLEEKGSFNLCPATIRGELKKLTDMGYLKQPHTSSGRVPTSKGYRFFVDNMSNDAFLPDFDIFDETDELKFIKSLSRNLASFSSSLVITYMQDKDILWKDGWKEVFNNPEFKEPDFLDDFIKTVDYLEKNIEKLANDQMQVYIGDEKPLKSGNFSLIISKTKFPEQDNGILAILGPNRMAYDRNIGIINSLLKEFERF